MSAGARVYPSPGRPGASPGRAAGPGTRWLPPITTTLTWAVAAAWVAALSYRAITTAPHMVDLGVYRTAGGDVLAGHPVYAIVARSQLPELGRSLLVFTYPPISAVLAVPLALVSRLTSQIAWIAMICVPLGVVVGIAFRPLISRAGRYGPAVAALAFIACLWTFPIQQEFTFGQVDILLAALCLADIAARHPRSPRGVLIGLATAIKLTPAVFIVYLVLTGRRRAALVSALTAVGCTALAWVIIPSGSAYYWTSAIFDSRRLGRNAQISNQSIRGMLLRIFLPGAPPGWLWPVLAAGVAIAGFALARRCFHRGDDMAGVVIVGLLAVLISPVSWIHHLVWVPAAIGVILGDGQRPRRWLIAAATALFFIAASPYQGRAGPGALGPSLFQIIWQDSYGLAALALMAALALLPHQPVTPPSPLTAPPGPPRWLDDPTAVVPAEPARAGR